MLWFTHHISVVKNYNKIWNSDYQMTEENLTQITLYIIPLRNIRVKLIIHVTNNAKKLNVNSILIFWTKTEKKITHTYPPIILNWFWQIIHKIRAAFIQPILNCIFPGCLSFALIYIHIQYIYIYQIKLINDFPISISQFFVIISKIR